MNPRNSCRPAPFPLITVLRQRPAAVAEISGSDDNPQLRGTVRFYQTSAGVLVYTEVNGLSTSDSTSGDRVFGFHIHSGNSCSGGHDDPFSDAMTHYDPDGSEHPYHSGDLPPLFGNNGHALSVFLTDRFSVDEVVGRVVIIHGKPDDFTTQPSGNSGMKIACGVIRRSGRTCV